MIQKTRKAKSTIHQTIRDPFQDRSGGFKLQLPSELSNVHPVFHVSNLKKCVSDKILVVPLDEIEVNENILFVEEPVEIMEREVKRTKQSRIPIVKVRWSAKHGPEFTWERKDQMMQTYPHLFSSS